MASSTILRRSCAGVRVLCFVVRVACRQEDDKVQTDFVGKGAGDVEVAVVDGVKRAAE